MTESIFGILDLIGMIINVQTEYIIKSPVTWLIFTMAMIMAVLIVRWGYDTWFR